MKKLFLALPLLLAGCQSERVAFQFQPVAPAKRAALIDRPAAAVPTTAEAPVAEAAAVATAGQGQPTVGRVARQPRPAKHTDGLTATERPASAPVTLASESFTTLASTRPHPLRTLALRQLVRQRATAGPARTAENGLGGIALFFIALALGIVAGLGALVSVIFGTGFFTGVGFAAAGLVVLFLLYSLFSGGKKKAKVK